MLIEPYREVTKSSGHRKFELSENLKQITGNKEIIISKWMGRECNEATRIVNIHRRSDKKVKTKN